MPPAIDSPSDPVSGGTDASDPPECCMTAGAAGLIPPNMPVELDGGVGLSVVVGFDEPNPPPMPVEAPKPPLIPVEAPKPPDVPKPPDAPLEAPKLPGVLLEAPKPPDGLLEPPKPPAVPLEEEVGFVKMP